MDFQSLDNLIKMISTSADLTTLIINLKQLGVRISGKTLQDIRNDHFITEDILHECFMRKEIMWQRYEYENKYWSINSLIDLQEKCDRYHSTFRTTNNEKHYFFSQLMRSWGNYCNEAYKELYRNQNDNDYREIVALKPFRRKSLKVVVTLIQALPDSSFLKQQAFDKIDVACKNSVITYKQILPEWLIDQA
ncbi:hypothetical protein [Spirosoma foliorum]|uniref:Uncharacterized protein n=1 Tax=Spirosoma foliorum TaxID=2710596 RepID=A0A7G5GXT9_9BACT|nr:hypothetical protein [Spirosoma foliorum]QMW03681.1 hypothetical protein H3H32_01610 [Spirosoma foliorum]